MDIGGLDRDDAGGVGVVAAGGVEDAFETAKTELGLAHDETRSWHGWHRHVSLAMMAFALPAVIRQHANAPPPKRRARARPSPPRLRAR